MEYARVDVVHFGPLPGWKLLLDSSRRLARPQSSKVRKHKRCEDDGWVYDDTEGEWQRKDHSRPQSAGHRGYIDVETRPQSAGHRGYIDLENDDRVRGYIDIESDDRVHHRFIDIESEDSWVYDDEAGTSEEQEEEERYWTMQQRRPLHRRAPTRRTRPRDDRPDVFRRPLSQRQRYPEEHYEEDSDRGRRDPRRRRAWNGSATQRRRRPVEEYPRTTPRVRGRLREELNARNCSGKIPRHEFHENEMAGPYLDVNERLSRMVADQIAARQDAPALNTDWDGVPHLASHDETTVTSGQRQRAYGVTRDGAFEVARDGAFEVQHMDDGTKQFLQAQDDLYALTSAVIQ